MANPRFQRMEENGSDGIAIECRKEKKDKKGSV
jgi:hypothetical protein